MGWLAAHAPALSGALTSLSASALPYHGYDAVSVRSDTVPQFLSADA